MLTNKQLRILLLEDQAEDAELALRELRRDGIDHVALRVANEADFLTQLRQFNPDLVLADHGLPAYDCLAALQIARKECPEAPFIFLSGTLHEGMAIEALRRGATDYVLKHRLEALVPAVRRALREIEERRERQRAETKLRASEERWRMFFEYAPDAYYLHDLDGTVVDANKAAEELVGGPRGEFIGKGVLKMELIHAQDHPKAAAMLQRSAQGESTGPEELTILRKDGSFRTVEVRTYPVQVQGRVLVLGIARDVTARKQMETQLMRAQRLESIGRLASGIAHDLNNVLTPLMMGVQLLRESRCNDSERALVETLENCVKRGAAIVHQVLLFARGSEGTRGLVSPKELLREFAGILQETFPRSIHLKIEIGDDLWPVWADATQLQQVLMNFSVNARDAMPEGGSLTLRVENVTLEKAAATLDPRARAGRYVMLAVEDSGTGIPPEVQVKMFDPFFTTKPVGQGTGLGLSIALGIIESHGGFLLVDSKAGEGAAFRVYLPALAAGKDAASHVPASPRRGRGELLLVVDDELSVRELVRANLEASGYNVIAAAGGDEALTLFRERHSHIHAAIVDLLMPGMNGRTLIRELLALEPRMPILAISGSAQEEENRTDGPLGVRAVLPKPFAASTLLEWVATLLPAAQEPGPLKSEA
jgi:PAS domain S-box-containing protein